MPIDKHERYARRLLSNLIEKGYESLDSLPADRHPVVTQYLAKVRANLERRDNHQKAQDFFLEREGKADFGSYRYDLEFIYGPGARNPRLVSMKIEEGTSSLRRDLFTLGEIPTLNDFHREREQGSREIRAGRFVTLDNKGGQKI